VTESVSFGVLGPFRVVAGGRELSIASAKQRALLAALLLGRGRVVSVSALIDDLWGPTPPASAEHLVQVYVSGLRARLRPSRLDERLLTEAPGYRFVVRDGELDAERFEELVSSPEPGGAALAEALALCRGDVLADVALEGDAGSEARRLDELCLSAYERRLEAELEGGSSAHLIAELERLAATHPYRERFARLLMSALYRAGRQADALAVYRETRQKLVEELGIEPGRALRDLQSAILRQDPALDDLPQPEPSSDGAPRRRRWYLAAAGALAAAVAVAVPLLELNAGASLASAHVGAGSVAVFDERSGRVVAARRIGDAPGSLIKVRQVLAVADSEDRTLELVNPKTLAVERSVGLPDSPRSLGESGWTVWIAYAYTGRIGWYDLRSGFLSQEYRPTANSEGLVAMAPTTQRIWVSIRDGGLVALSPTSLRVLWASSAGPFTVLTHSEGSLWGIGFSSGDVSRIDLDSGKLRSTTPLSGTAQGITAGADAIWVTTTGPARVYRLDPRSGQVSWFVPLGADPDGIVVGTDAVWVASGQMLLRIDPKSRELVSTTNLRRPISDLAAGDKGHLFVTTG
jgi:DNA-binding SARP family transcriptional activator/DNA-binding beta-propeller fold protein YncE